MMNQVVTSIKVPFCYNSNCIKTVSQFIATSAYIVFRYASARNSQALGIPILLCRLYFFPQMETSGTSLILGRQTSVN